MTDKPHQSIDRIRPFSERLKENGLGITTGYKLVAEGQIRVVKVGNKTCVRDSDWAEFLANLPELRSRSRSRRSAAA